MMAFLYDAAIVGTMLVGCFFVLAGLSEISNHIGRWRHLGDPFNWKDVLRDVVITVLFVGVFWVGIVAALTRWGS